MKYFEAGASAFAQLLIKDWDWFHMVHYESAAAFTPSRHVHGLKSLLRLPEAHFASFQWISIHCLNVGLFTAAFQQDGCEQAEMQKSRLRPQAMGQVPAEHPEGIPMGVTSRDVNE